jgi:predicted DNA-binding protein YlxM (UPF0122 family)
MAIVKTTKKDTTTKSKSRQINYPDSKYFDDYSIFDDTKEGTRAFNKYLKTIKAMMRKSLEYKELMRFLKHYKGLDRCGYHHNVTVQEFDINIHHYPFCAEDLITIVLYKRYKLNETIEALATIQETLYLHYLGIIGLYPLCKTCHGYQHSEEGDPFIPFSDLYGEVEEFFEIYKEFMTEKQVNKFVNFRELSKGVELLDKYIGSAYIRKYLYVENSDGSSFITIGKLLNELERLNK